MFEIGNRYRQNKKRGRLRKVARCSKHGETNAIGLIGKCIVTSKNDHYPNELVAKVSDAHDFKQYMIDEFNFLEFEAKRITQDRRSYYAIPLMDVSMTDIIGVLFLDSKSETTFPISKVEEEIKNKYVPRIAKLLVQKDEKEFDIQ